MQTHEHSEPLLIGVLPLDICRNRHRDNAESVLANTRVDKAAGQREVMATLGYAWLTSKEIAALMDKPLNCISGRISELKKAGKIEVTGNRRHGCAELRKK